MYYTALGLSCYYAPNTRTDSGPYRGLCNWGGCEFQDLPTKSTFSAKKIFPEIIFSDDLPPAPPRRQKIFGQCTILGVEKNFSDIPKIFQTYKLISRVGRPIVRFVLYYTIADIMNSKITDRLILKTDHYLFCINLPTILKKPGGCHTPNTPCLGTPLRTVYNRKLTSRTQDGQNEYSKSN